MTEALRGPRQELSPIFINSESTLLFTDITDRYQTQPAYRRAAGLAYPSGERSLEFFINNVRHLYSVKKEKTLVDRLTLRITDRQNHTDEKIILIIDRVKKESPDNVIIYQKFEHEKGTVRTVVDDRNTRDVLREAKRLVASIPTRSSAQKSA